MLSIDIALYHKETIKMNSFFSSFTAESELDLVLTIEDSDNKKYLYLIPRVFNSGKKTMYGSHRTYLSKNFLTSLNSFIATVFPDEVIKVDLQTVGNINAYSDIIEIVNIEN
mgnify:CR=1 FL=1|tara:strand:+ start:143 stop:478 length:336 start_codon:yes stop_codon:yes gene_type:complete